MILDKNESIKYVGGAINASFINATSRLISTVYTLGKEFGMAVKRIIYHCNY